MPDQLAPTDLGVGRGFSTAEATRDSNNPVEYRQQVEE